MHAAPPTQYKTFMSFSTNWLSEGSTSRYTCKEQQISRPGYLPVIISTRKVAEQRSLKTAFSYDSFIIIIIIIIIIFFLQTKYLFRQVFRPSFRSRSKGGGEMSIYEKERRRIPVYMCISTCTLGGLGACSSRKF